MRNTNCPVCQKRKALIHPTYGVLPCTTCRMRRDAFSLPDVQVEMTSDSIKQGRREYAKSIIQPYRAGELSKEYLDAYGTKNISPTEKEIKKAKYVWKDSFGSVDIQKSK